MLQGWQEARQQGELSWCAHKQVCARAQASQNLVDYLYCP
jgi:hypothetical protein